MHIDDSTKRFSNRVELYLQYRPRYPVQFIAFCKEQLGLTPSWVVADIGSGTGFSAEPFLENGNTVFGIEPNPEMRQAAETSLARFPNFRSLDGRAEATTLADDSIDMVAAGQAFHWFDPAICKIEFNRILKENGWTVLFWNQRKLDSAFATAYEELIRKFAVDYTKVDHKNIDSAALEAFFGNADFRNAIFDYFQELDFDGLKGRLLSSSYMPIEGPRHVELIQELTSLFSNFQKDGKVRIEYETVLYYGHL